MNAPMDHANVVRHPSAAAALPALPTSLEAEQGVLGSMLVNGEVIGVVSSIIRPTHFAEEIHKRIFSVALELAKASKPITIGTLKSYLGDHDLGGLTTSQYLARLASNAAPPILSGDYAREVRDMAIRREIVEIGQRLDLEARGAFPSLTGADIVGPAIEALQKIADIAVAADTRRDAGSCAQALVDRARAIMAGEKQDSGVPTGLKELDLATGGFQPGTLWIIAGRPRMGKSVLGTGFARRVARRGARDLEEGREAVGAQFFSLELPEDQIIARFLSDLAYSPRSPVTFGNIMTGSLTESDFWAVEEAQRKLAALPLALDVAESLTVQDIGARIRSEKARMAKKGIRLSVVFLDYLKFIKASDRYKGNRVYEVGEISGSLKQLAKREGVCIVLLAQVNRQVDGRDRKDRAPGLADLRDSGDLEADTDVVLFIDRESIRIKQSPEYKRGDEEAVAEYATKQHEAELIVAKTRMGAERSFKIWFDAGASAFASEARGGS